LVTWTHPVLQIRPVDAGVDHVDVRAVQLLADVLDHILGGGGGQRQHRRAAQRLNRRRHLDVGRPEVVAPLRDAVRLVDHHQVHLHLPQQVDELGHRQPLRGAEHDLALGGGDRLERGRLFLVAQAAVDLDRAHAELLELFELVLHQGNKGRHHDRHPVEDARRNLVAQRLAAAGGHDCQRVFAVQNAIDHSLLAVAQVLDAEDRAQQAADGVAANGEQAAMHKFGVVSGHD
jgi:hypothetical protein